MKENQKLKRNLISARSIFPNVLYAYKKNLASLFCLILIHRVCKSYLCFNRRVSKISEEEFEKICSGIYDDRDSICKHNPIGTREETLLWMLLSCLISYLSISEIETPCFTGIPTAETYRQAILFVLKDRKVKDFDAEKYLDLLK